MTRAIPITIGDPVPITREDLAVLDRPRHVTSLTAIKDSHHRIARLIAAGFRTFEIAKKTGYNVQRIGMLRSNPAMQELIAKYRDKVDAAYERGLDDYADLATANMMKAEALISDRLDEALEGEALPIRDLVSISRDAADRFGYGKRSTNVNLNADFAAQLEAAIARSGVTIEAGTEPLKRRA